MKGSTHFNEINNSDYMVKHGIVYVWIGRWSSMTPFKEADITADNGFIEVMG